MKRGEIWLVSLDPTSGHEQKGRRPVLIVSPEAFNRITKVPVVLPITSGNNFARTADGSRPGQGLRRYRDATSARRAVLVAVGDVAAGARGWRSPGSDSAKARPQIQARSVPGRNGPPPP